MKESSDELFQNDSAFLRRKLMQKSCAVCNEDAESEKPNIGNWAKESEKCDAYDYKWIRGFCVSGACSMKYHFVSMATARFVEADVR